MNAGLVMERLDPQGGGLEQWAWAFACALARRNWNVTVFAFRAAERLGELPFGVRLLPWSDDRMQRARVVEGAVRGFDGVVHDLGVGWSAHVLHPQTGCRLANYRRQMESLGWNERWLARARPREREWLRQVRLLEERQFRQGTGRVVAVSRMVAADLREFHGVSEARLRVVPNGVDTSRFSVPDARRRAALRTELGFDGKVVYLFAASNPRLKGLMPLLRAFAEAANERPDLQLVVIGKDAEPVALRSVRRLKLERRVTFAGRVADARAYFAAADAFALPSYYDACSLSVLEACACGLPVITTAQNGVSELLSGGEGAVLGSADDVAGLARAILKLGDAGVRAAASRSAIETAALHTFERNVDEMIGVYADAI